MSLEKCRKMSLKRQREERKASGLALGEQITIYEGRSILGFPAWIVSFIAYGAVSLKYFYRRKSADKYFDELVQKYGLKEVGVDGD